MSQSNTLTESLNFYGEKISTENIIDYDTFIENSKVVSKSKIEGTILSSCPKKGCWMQVKVETDTLQVTFKDYGFFVPKKGLENKTVIIEGFAKRDTLSIQKLRHYAEDAGKSKADINQINNPEFKISFVANGVIIKQ